MRTLRLALVLVLLWLPLATWAFGGWAASGALRFDATAAPAQVGAHRAVKDEPLEVDVLDMLKPDSYVMRLYTARGSAPVWLYLASYSGRDTTGAHDPAVCYPSTGWDLQGLRDREVELASGESLTSRLLLAAQSGREELVLYWFQPVGRWPSRAPFEQLLRAYDGFAGRPQYVFVRLSTELDHGQAAGEAMLVEFARELAPWLRGAMDPEPQAPQRAQRAGGERSS
jgi:EpsI family protein